MPQPRRDVEGAFDGGAMTVQQACEFSGIGRTTLYGLLGKEIACARVGRRVLVSRASLLAFLESHATDDGATALRLFLGGK